MNVQRTFLLFFLYLSNIPQRTQAISTRNVTLKEFDKIKLDEKGYNKMVMIHYNWYLQTIKALMGQMGKQLMKKLNQSQKRDLLRCLDRVEDKRDVVSAGVCLVKAKDAHEEMQVQRGNFVSYKENLKAYKSTSKEMPAFKQKLNDDKDAQILEPSIRPYPPHQSMFSKQKKPQHRLRHLKKHFKQSKGSGFLLKTKIRSIKAAKSQSLELEIQDRLNNFRRQLKRVKISSTRKYLRQKHKRNCKSLIRIASPKREEFRRKPEFRMFTRRVKRSPYRLVTNSVSKSDSEKFVIKHVPKTPALLENVISPIQHISRSIMKLVNNRNEAEVVGTWSKTYGDILSLKKKLDKQAKEPGAKVYDLRMYDLVLGRDCSSESIFEKVKQPGFITEAFGLAGRLNKNGNRNFKFLSPRFASVMPDKYESKKSLLSPSLFSLYRDDAENQILPIPKLLEASGLEGKDRDAVLELVMEISGAKDVINDAVKVISNMNLFGMEGELLEVTKKSMEIFKSLEKSFNHRQHNEMKKRGFTFTLPHQIEKLHKEQGLLDKAHDFNYAYYSTLSHSHKEEALWLRIRQIASNTTEVGDFEATNQLFLISAET